MRMAMMIMMAKPYSCAKSQSCKRAILIAVFGLICLSSVGRAEPPTVKCVYDRIQSSLSGKSEKIEVPAPGSVSLGYTPKQARSYFKAAYRMVEEGFDRKEILSAIDDVLAGKEPPSKLSKHLAQMRKGLKTLRFAYEAFDVHHEIPESLNRLIIKLGHLDDALKSHSPRVAQEEAKTIKAALKKKNLKESFESAKSFEPETEEGFWRWEKSARATITNALNAGDVSAVEFHDVRKTLGRYFTVLNAQQVYQPVENGDGVIRFTNKLYQDLGDFHDKMEAAKMEELQKALQASEKLTSAKKQQIVDAADAARVQFTPELRTGLTQFLDSLKP